MCRPDDFPPYDDPGPKEAPMLDLAALRLATTTDRRTRTIARYPDRRAHAFWSPWPGGAMTTCERCGIKQGVHAPDPKEA
jgi:hypothetical protein